MSKITLQQLGLELRNKRGSRGLREVADEIGVSAPTLSRIESGKQPDLDTFAKICRWLSVNPAEVLGISEQQQDLKSTFTNAHFRAGKELTGMTASKLTEAIMAMHNYLSAHDQLEERNEWSSI